MNTDKDIIRETDRLCESSEGMTLTSPKEFLKRVKEREEETLFGNVESGLNLITQGLNRSSAIFQILGQIVENSKDLVIVVSMKGEIEYLNQNMAGFLEYSKENLLNQSADKIFNFKKFLKLMKKGRPEIMLINKSGKSMILNSKAKIINDISNKPEYLVIQIPFTDYACKKLRTMNTMIKYFANAEESEIHKYQYKGMMQIVHQEIKKLI